MALAISPRFLTPLCAGIAACAALLPIAASAQEADSLMTRADFVYELTLNTYPPESFADCYGNLSPTPFNLLFADVSRDEPYGPSLCIGMMGGYVSGYSDATFRPNNPMTFAEASPMLAKAYGFRTFPAPNNLPWYEPYVRVLAKNGAIPLTISGPNHKLTIGEAQEIMDRLANGVTTRSSKSERDVEGWWK